MKDIRLGFTGTQDGMTEEQYMRVASLVSQLKDRIEFATHGDCIGADEEFDAICASRDIKVYLRPCDITEKRANCKGNHIVYTDAVAPPLHRNEVIVDTSNLLIATPKGFEMQRRSGTWTTVRRAIRAGIAHVIVYPDGTWKKVAPAPGVRLPAAKVDASLGVMHTGTTLPARSVEYERRKGGDHMATKEITIKDPDAAASDKQLWFLNKEGRLAIVEKKGNTITKGAASSAISKLRG